LLGVVPEDRAVIASGNRGTIMALDSFGPAAQAYLNIARRITGQRVRLLDRIPGREWRK
jgi:septum site-determining protein MinD